MVTAATTLITVLLTILIFYLSFFVIVLFSAFVIFPEKLKTTWPTVDPATRVLDSVRLAVFLAAMAALAGSLGGAAERKDIIRHVIFLDEET